MPGHLRFSAISGDVVAGLCLLYAGVLAIGLFTLPSPDQAIQDPWFTLMELLILAIAPAMVMLTVALHSWAIDERKAQALLSVLFMGMCATVTCCVHFAVLTLSHHSAFAGREWAPLVFSFTWPSIAYALDILAWDFFFPLSALFAALAVHGSGLASLVRGLLFTSSALAFIGLAGLPTGNMNIRNIGILGYAVIFPVAAIFLSHLFRRAQARSAP